jgi:hypothetical protein
MFLGQAIYVLGPLQLRLGEIRLAYPATGHAYLFRPITLLQRQPRVQNVSPDRMRYGCLEPAIERRR